MKQGGLFLTAAILFVAGCNYQVPVTEEHSISVDPHVLGLWERFFDENETADPAERMLILKYTDTEYLGHYERGDAGMYFRGYPISIGGVSCVQIQLVGTSKGDIKKEHRKYQVLSYELSNGEMEIRMLNIDLVDKSLQDTLELRKAFLKHSENEDLFRELGKFRKVKDKD